ncbi:Sister chromatid cohesion protein pds5 [Malassezia cuniculi]|uniref:Sister chromatid cohesion protein pds5 n=1 Tax=Malassezia cuniculi TaxID=948313 RepID=A0AAF0J5N6_9BASI|nr:Sister chromatid cohesion protein pds5 [Malassezia cuniculi]
MARPALLDHRDASVRAYGACILADMLRLYAPNAPFQGKQLKRIFVLFVDVLAAPGILATPSDPLHAQTVYLLESLSTVQSAVLIYDVPGADAAVAQLFQKMLQAADGLSKHAELCVIDLLSQLVDESEQVPPGVFEALVAALDSSAAHISASVLRSTSDRLQRDAARYFSEELAEPDSDAYSAVENVAASVPQLLLSVTPILESQLEGSTKVRAAASATLGRMFSASPSHGAERRPGGVAELYPTTWRAWLARSGDKNASIRISVIDAARDALAEYPALAKDVSAMLSARLADPDERVRESAARALGGLEYDILLHHVPETTIRALGSRARDKSARVRAVALDALGRMYAAAAPELERGSTAAQSFAWIPGVMLRCSLVQALDVMSDAGLSFARHIVSAGDMWPSRLVDLVDALDDDEKAALVHYANLRLARPSVFDRYIHACETRSDENAAAAAAEALGCDTGPLHAFWRSRDAGALRLLRRAVDVRATLQDACGARSDLLAHFDEPQTAGALERIAVAGGYPIIAQDMIPALLELSGERQSAAYVLRHVARLAPQLLLPHADMLVNEAQNNSTLGHILLAALVKHRPGAVKPTPDLVLHLAAAMRTDTDEASAAAQTLSIISAKDKRVGAASSTLRAAADELVAHLPDELCPSTLRALASVLKHAPASMTDPDAAVDTAIKQVIFAKWAGGPLDGTWVDDKHAPNDLTRCLAALRLITRRVVAAGDTTVAEPALALLWRLASSGETEDLGTPEAAKSRMRAYAAVCILKLARCPAYMALVDAHMPRLVHILQDEEHKVRMAVLHKLLVYLTRRQLPSSMHALIYMVAHDPDDEMRVMVQSYTRRNAAVVSAEIRREAFETLFALFIALLASHPDLDLSSPASIVEYAVYLEFYLVCVSSAQNITYLASVAAGVRRASITHIDTCALHTISQLASAVVERHAARCGWDIGTLQQIELAAPFIPHSEDESRLSPRVIDLLDKRPHGHENKRVRRA